jgi:hypothetical protein
MAKLHKTVTPSDKVIADYNLPDQGPYTVTFGSGKKSLLFTSNSSNIANEIPIATAADAVRLLEELKVIASIADLQKDPFSRDAVNREDFERYTEEWEPWRSTDYSIKFSTNIHRQENLRGERPSGMRTGCLIKHKSVTGEEPHYHITHGLYSREIRSHYKDKDGKRTQHETYSEVDLDDSFIDRFIVKLP